MRYHLIIIGVSIVFTTSIPGASAISEVLTINQIYIDGITSYVRENIQIRSHIIWSNEPRGYVLPAKRSTSAAQQDSLFATSITFNFQDENLLGRPFKDQERSNIFLVSSELTTQFNHELVEEYYYRGTLLRTDILYHLEGQFAYRDWIGGGDPPIENPDFIKQSNDPVYWSQTFEFHVFDMKPITYDPTMIRTSAWSQVKSFGIR